MSLLWKYCCDTLLLPAVSNRSGSMRCVLMCKPAGWRPPIGEQGSLKVASDHSGGPRRVRGRKTSAEWRAATWRIGPQWGVCGGLGDLKPPHSPLRCLFMPLTRSPVLCLCSYSEQVGWVTHLLCSGLSLAISPFSSSSCSLPPFFVPSPFYFPLIRLSISTVSPGPSVHFRCSDGQISTDWVSGVGRGGFREEEEQERRVGVWESCLLFSHVVAVDWRSVCALSVEVSHLPEQQCGSLCSLGSFLSCCSVSSVDTAGEPQHHRCPSFCDSKMSTFSFAKNPLGTDTLSLMCWLEKGLCVHCLGKMFLLLVENLLSQKGWLLGAVTIAVQTSKTLDKQRFLKPSVSLQTLH